MTKSTNEKQCLHWTTTLVSLIILDSVSLMLVRSSHVTPFLTKSNIQQSWHPISWYECSISAHLPNTKASFHIWTMITKHLVMQHDTNKDTISFDIVLMQPPLEISPQYAIKRWLNSHCQPLIFLRALVISKMETRTRNTRTSWNTILQWQSYV